nr:hypothetical protein [Tanacetum cinerariifolium]
AYEKKLIQVLKIHTDDNVADLVMKAFDVSSKELASPKQTALGKDESNPLIVDSLLKTIWSSMHHVIEMKHWLFHSKWLLDVGEAQDDVYMPTEPSTSKPLKNHKSKKQQPKVPKAPSPVPSPEHQLPSPSTNSIPTDQDSLTLQELMDLCKTLSNKVLDLESKVIDLKSSFTHRIAKLEDRVDQLEKANKALKEKSFKTTQVDTVAPEEPAEMEEVFEVVKAAKLMTEVVTTAQPTTTAAQVPKPSAPRRKRGVIIQDPEETATLVIVHSRVQSKDKGKGILIEEPKPLKGQAQIDMDEAFSRQLEAELNANINWNDVIEQGRYGLAKVKSWKLFESCRVHVITFTTTQMILLVEKKYHLTHFTLQQMLDNVRLKVEEESEMYLEMLRLVRR